MALSGQLVHHGWGRGPYINRDMEKPPESRASHDLGVRYYPRIKWINYAKMHAKKNPNDTLRKPSVFIEKCAQTWKLKLGAVPTVLPIACGHLTK